jgi:undecaprenyl diphosphate synthase
MNAVTPLAPEAKAELPQHVAVIMDGNGRWAKARHLPRIEGHRRGADSAREIIRAAGELGIKYLTLYAFSAENWNRPKDEVDALMKYLVHYLKTETKDLDKNNVRLEVIGQIYRLPENVQEHLQKLRQPDRDRRSCPRHRRESKGRQTRPGGHQRAAGFREPLDP